MYKNGLKHITEGKTFIGLEIYDIEGVTHFSVLQLQHRKGELLVTHEQHSENLEELIPKIDKRKPLFLTINTSKVLKKEVLNEVKNNPELLVVNAFPNLELDNFYYQLIGLSEKSFVAIAKKEYIEGYLEQFKKLKLTPYQVTLGISQIENILTFCKDKTIQGSNFSFDYFNDNIQNYTPSTNAVEEKLNINGLTLSSRNLLPFSHILGHFQNVEQISNLNQINITHTGNFKNARVFDLMSKCALGFFLMLLLINFLVFSYYEKENQMLEVSLSSNQIQGKAFQNLKNRVDDKSDRLETLLASSNSKTSYFLDQLAKGVPSSIWLNGISYQPLVHPVRTTKPISQEKNTIHVSGISNDKTTFSIWSEDLERLDWIEKIEIMDYDYISNSSSSFTINLTINEIE